MSGHQRTHTRSAPPAPDSLLVSVKQWSVQLDAALGEFLERLEETEHEGEKIVLGEKSDLCNDCANTINDILGLLESFGDENVAELSSTPVVQGERQYITERIEECQREDSHPINLKDLHNHLEYLWKLIRRFEHITQPVPERPASLLALTHAAGIPVLDDEHSLFHPKSRRAAIFPRSL